MLEVWPETRFSPSRRFLSDDCRCNSGFLNRITATIMPHKTIIRLSSVARNPANGFPARPLGVRPAQRGPLESDHLYLDYVGRGSFYGFLASLRGQLFRDEDFAELYCPDNGRDSVPPSLVTKSWPAWPVFADAL